MTTSDAELAALFLEFSRNKLLNQYWPRLRSSVEPLTDDQVWWRPNPACNSVGNLVLHLNGNVRQWLIASFSGLEDTRNRPAEFNERRRIAGKLLVQQLDSTMQEAGTVFDHLTARDLAATYQIQGYTVRGIDAVYQVVEHFGMHYGQVLYINKMLRGEDLGFHRELNLTGRAS
jgi:uncharacterized protein DUF1572